MMSLSPWTAIRCMWLRSQAHRGKPEGHACHASPCSVSSRRFAGFAQKAATHRCSRLDVPTPCHHHHATAPPHIRQGSPLLRIERKSLESLAALALFTFAFLGSELFFDMRMGMPMPLEGAVWAQALILGASVAGILAPTALLRPPQAQIRTPFTEAAGAITSHRPSSDPPSYSKRFDARLLRSVHRPHDQRNTQAAPSQSGSPSLRDVFA